MLKHLLGCEKSACMLSKPAEAVDREGCCILRPLHHTSCSLCLFLRGCSIPANSAWVLCELPDMRQLLMAQTAVQPKCAFVVLIYGGQGSWLCLREAHSSRVSERWDRVRAEKKQTEESYIQRQRLLEKVVHQQATWAAAAMSVGS